MNFLALVIFILVLVFSVLRRTAEESRRVGRRTFEPPPEAPLALPTEPAQDEPVFRELAEQVFPAGKAEEMTISSGFPAVAVSLEPGNGWDPGEALVQGIMLSEVLGPPRSLNPYRPVALAANRGR